MASAALALSPPEPGPPDEAEVRRVADLEAAEWARSCSLGAPAFVAVTPTTVDYEGLTLSWSWNEADGLLVQQVRCPLAMPMCDPEGCGPLRCGFHRSCGSVAWCGPCLAPFAAAGGLAAATAGAALAFPRLRRWTVSVGGVLVLLAAGVGVVLSLTTW